MGGSELRLGVAATPAACVDMVLAAHPDADGVTYGASSSCYVSPDSDVRSTVVAKVSTCPAMTVGTVILRALDRVRERALGLLGVRSPKSPPARRHVVKTSRIRPSSRTMTPTANRSRRVPPRCTLDNECLRSAKR